VCQPFDNLIKYVVLMSINVPDKDGGRNESKLTLTWEELQKSYVRIIDKLVIKIFENNIESELLNAALHKLSPIQRKILLLCVLHDFSTESTAYLLSTSKNNVYVQKCKALKRLKTIMEGVEKDDHKK